MVHMLAPHVEPKLGRTVVEAGNANLQVLSTALTRKDGIADSSSNRADTKELGACRTDATSRTDGRLVVKGRSFLRQEEGSGDGKYRSRHHRHHRHFSAKK